MVYSNFGMALLGHALATRAGLPYAELLTERLLRPLGMTDTVVQLGKTPVGDAAEGGSGRGRPVDPWYGEGYLPAGVGLWATAADLGRLLTATMGTAPGADAARPRFTDSSDRRVGYAWFTDRHDDREITWHNGATGGFRSYVGYDRAVGRGVAVLGNTDVDVERIGLRLLGGPVPEHSPSPFGLGVTVLLLLGAILAPLPVATAPVGRSRWWRPAPDRLRVATSVLSALTGLVLAHRIGAWLDVPPLAWSLAAVLAAVSGFLAVRRLPRLPAVAGRPRLRWSSSAAGSVLSLVLLGGALAVW